MEPSNLKNLLGNALKSDTLSEEKRQELTALHDSLNENDNNVIILARLKE